MKKNKNAVQDNKAVLNEKLSVAELRIYEGFYDEKDIYVPLTKVIVARDDDNCIDCISASKYNVYQMEDGKFYPFCNASDELRPGDVFCTIEQDLNNNENIFNYMVDSYDFYYYRLPYLQERFNLYAKSASSYVLPMLKDYQRRIKSDISKRQSVKTLLNEHVNILKEYYQELGNTKKIKMNTKKRS